MELDMLNRFVKAGLCKAGNPAEEEKERLRETQRDREKERERD